MSHPAYAATLEFLYQQLPMYQRVGAVAYKKDLSNTQALCKLLGQPQKKFKSIHVAGTNGKGSVSHMMAAVLQKSGYKTGLYTSPHLRDFRERIRINGKMIEEAQVVEFTELMKTQLEDLQPSFFEWTVAMAFHHFAQENVDIAVIETGLGGRLDSTNVITPILSVITNIGWDHMDMLGNTLEAIAGEKAGIIKPDVPVVIGESQAETSFVFEKVANEKRSLLKFADRIYSLNYLGTRGGYSQYEVRKGTKVEYEDLELDLNGEYQIHNLATVLTSIDQLNRAGFLIEKESIIEGLAQVQGLTGFAGRWTILGDSPKIIADTGHNENGLRLVMAQLKREKFQNLHFVLGVVGDKDLSKILPILPVNAKYYFCKSSIPRALNEVSLHAEAKKFGLEGQAYPTVGEALAAAKENAGSSDLIFIGGSTFTVADVI